MVWNNDNMISEMEEVLNMQYGFKRHGNGKLIHLHLSVKIAHMMEKYNYISFSSGIYTGLGLLYWMEDNCEGRCLVVYDRFYFECEDDALKFKLKFL